MQEHRFAAGQYIFGEGDPTDVAYLINADSVEVIKASSTGDLLLAVLHAGDILGEMGLIDEAPRSAAARALEPVVATAVDRDEFVQLILQRDAQGLALLRALFERLRVTNQLLLKEREARGALEVHPGARRIKLVGLTGEARASLPSGGVEANRLPLRIGRKPQSV